MLRDDPASVRLLERALALLPENDRAPVLVELANALDDVGDLDGCAATGTAALHGLGVQGACLVCLRGDGGSARRLAGRAVDDRLGPRRGWSAAPRSVALDGL